MRGLLAVFALVSTTVLAATADDLREAQRLYSQGKLPGALEKVDAYLAEQPRDAQARFLRGLVLADEKHTDQAIQIFKSLTEEFPELPEPYNNLAVLYASQGDYEKARATLELAIQANPSYAIAHENLGDIYARLAGRAYERALQLDANDASAKAKAAKIKEITAPPPKNP
jgi:tetratricopeptide (TPR) repeat protein